MKKLYTSVLIAVVVLVHVSPIAYGQQFEPGKLWVELKDKTLQPTHKQDTIVQTGNETLNELFVQELVTEFSKANPYSNYGVLAWSYQLACDCNESYLRDSLRTLFPNSFGTIARLPLIEPDFTPDDYTDNFSVTSGAPLWHLEKINAPDAWDISTGSNAVDLAVLDRYLNRSHPEIRDNFLRAWDMINQDTIVNSSCGICNSNHGTEVSQLAAGVTNNDYGMSSIGYGTSLSFYNIAETAGMFYEGKISASAGAAAISKAIREGADVINCSWSTSGIAIESDPGIPIGADTSYAPFSDAAFEEARQVGVTVVASAGNRGLDSNVYLLPAGSQNTIAVASVDSNDVKSDFSSFRSYIDISAPGEDMYTLSRVDTTVVFTGEEGTSYSAPLVAGTVALILSLNPCLDMDEVLHILRASSVNIDTLNLPYVDSIGAGRLNAGAALQLAQDSFLGRIPNVLSDTTLSSNATWNTDMLISGMVTVSDYTTLIIQNCSLEFDGHNSGLIVQPKAKLIIDSSTLTSRHECKRSMWNGIFADSYPDLNHSTLGTADSNAQVVFKHSSVIENAHIAISCGHNISGPLTPTNLHGGAWVFAENTSFKNNRIDVFFAPHRSKNFSKFKNCTFETTAPLIDLEKYDDRNCDAHVVIKDVYGVQFQSCDFENNIPQYYAKDKLGDGIRSFNSQFTIINNPSTDTTHFTNLYRAVDHYSLGSVLRFMRVIGARFTNNMMGITSNGSRQDVIMDNRFIVPFDSTPHHIITLGSAFIEYDTTWGIFMYDAQGSKVMNNKLSGQYYYDGTVSHGNTMYKVYGIVVRNSSYGGSIVSRNQLDSFDIAEQTEENNPNVQFRCNEHLKTKHAFSFNPGVFSTHDDERIYDSICPQGSECNAGNTAANTFDTTDFVFSGEFQLMVSGVNRPDTLYYMTGPEITDPKPECGYTPSGCIEDCGLTSDTGACYKVFGSYVFYPATSLANVTGSCPGCKAVTENEAHKMYAYFNGGTALDVQLTLNDVIQVWMERNEMDSLRMLLQLMNTPGATRALVASYELYKSMADYESLVLSKLDLYSPEESALYNLYYELGSRYFDTSIGLWSADSLMLYQLASCSDTGGLNTIYVQTWKAGIENSNIKRTPQPTYTPNERPYLTEAKTINENDNVISISPNPTQSVIRVRLPDDAFYSIEVLTIDGRLLLHQDDIQFSFDYTFDKEVSGMYFINVYNTKNALLKSFKEAVIKD